MHGKTKVYLSNLEKNINYLIKKHQSSIIFGARRTGKTTLVKKCLSKRPDIINFPLQNPEIGLEMESDPSTILTV